MTAVWPGRERCAIAGIGSTEFSRRAGRSELRLAAEAADAAMADVGIEPSEVDGIVRCETENVSSNALADTIGFENPTFWAETGTGGAAPCGQIGLAVAARAWSPPARLPRLRSPAPCAPRRCRSYPTAGPGANRRSQPKGRQIGKTPCAGATVIGDSRR
jgi:hypothetical protein